MFPISIVNSRFAVFLINTKHLRHDTVLAYHSIQLFRLRIVVFLYRLLMQCYDESFYFAKYIILRIMIVDRNNGFN